MNIGKRIQIHGPQWASILSGELPWWQCWGGHGSDEYMNCSVYFQTALLGGFVLFWDPHFQLDTECPDSNYGPHSWNDAAVWQRWFAAKFGAEDMFS